MVGLRVCGTRADGLVAQSSLDALNRLLMGTTSVGTIKAVIPLFSTIYPIIFKLLYVSFDMTALTRRATSRPPSGIYEVFENSKARILSLALDRTAQPQSVGIKAAAWKFVQKVLLAGTRAAAADPRVSLLTLGHLLMSAAKSWRERPECQHDHTGWCPQRGRAGRRRKPSPNTARHPDVLL